MYKVPPAARVIALAASRISRAAIDVLFLGQRGADLVELLETAKQIFVALQVLPGRRPDTSAPKAPYLMQTART